MAIDLLATLRLKDDFTKPLESAKSGLGKVGKMAGVAGAAVAAFGVGSKIKDVGMDIAKTGIQFTDSMSHLEAVTGLDKGSKELQALQDKTMELGQKSVFSASEAADAATYLGMAGFNTEQILGSLGNTLNLAAAGGLDLADAADIASNVMSGFGMMTGDVEANAARVADVLAKAASSSNTNVQQLGDAMSYAAPVANAYNISLEESAAAVGIFSDAGIQGSRAGMTLKNSIAKLANPVGATKKVLENAGVAFEKVNPEMNSMADILDELTKAGFTSADAIDLVGMEAGPGFAAMMEVGSDALREFEKELIESGGTSEKMAESMTNNLGGDIKALGSMLETLKLKLFFDKESFLRDAVQGVTDFVKKIIDSLPKVFSLLERMAPALKAFGVALGIIGTAIGAVIVVKGLAIAFGLLLSPVGLVVAGIMAVGTALVWAYKNIEGFKKGVDRTVQIMKDLWKAFKPKSKLTADEIADLDPFVQKVIGVKDKVINAWNAMGNAIKKTKSWFSDVGDALKASFAGDDFDFTKIFGDNKFTEIFQKAYDAFNDFRTKFSEGIDDIKEAWEGVKEAFNNFIEPIKEAVTSVGELMSQVGESIVEVWNHLMEALAPIFEALGELFSALGELYMEIFLTIWTPVIEMFKSAWEGVKSAFTAIVDWLKEKWSEFATAFKEKYDSFIQPVLDWFMEKFEEAKAIVIPILDAIRDAFQELGEKMQETWQTYGEPFVSWVSDKLTGAVETAKGIIDGFGGAFERVAGFIEGATEKVKGFIDKVKNIKMPDISLPSFGGGKGHYHGLSRVPYDGYQATLHKGEAVLTAKEVKALEGGRHQYGEDSGALTRNQQPTDVNISGVVASDEHKEMKKIVIQNLNISSDKANPHEVANAVIEMLAKQLEMEVEFA